MNRIFMCIQQDDVTHSLQAEALYVHFIGRGRTFSASRDTLLAFHRMWAHFLYQQRYSTLITIAAKQMWRQRKFCTPHFTTIIKQEIFFSILHNCLQYSCVCVFGTLTIEIFSDIVLATMSRIFKPTSHIVCTLIENKLLQFLYSSAATPLTNNTDTYIHTYRLLTRRRYPNISAVVCCSNMWMFCNVVKLFFIF